MASNIKQPEMYWTRPNKHCPNSKLPILVYRNVLPEDLTVESARSLVESNDWSYDRSWSHDGRAHFHPNTHECYAALKGSATCLYGVGPLDDQNEGVKFFISAGDVAVHAAGVSHRNFESTEDYLYMGIYPKDAPHYKSLASTCDPEDTKVNLEEAEKVPIPHADPIYGLNGPLPTLWKEAAAGLISYNS